MCTLSLRYFNIFLFGQLNPPSALNLFIPLRSTKRISAQVGLLQFYVPKELLSELKSAKSARK
jgi:hypothetical protein